MFSWGLQPLPPTILLVVWLLPSQSHKESGPAAKPLQRCPSTLHDVSVIVSLNSLRAAFMSLISFLSFSWLMLMSYKILLKFVLPGAFILFKFLVHSRFVLAGPYLVAPELLVKLDPFSIQYLLPVVKFILFWSRYLHFVMFLTSVCSFTNRIKP
jgi:hypothetical protein